MGLISAADAERLRGDLAAMTRPVRLLFFTQTLDCDTCLQARQIIDELPPLSDQITIEEVNLVLERQRADAFGIDRAPALVPVGVEPDGTTRDSHIRFLGAPSGYEFASLLRAILLVGGGAPILSEANRARVAALERPMSIHVFTTPTCPHCPRAVVLAHELAWANPNITAYAVEATEFPDLARRYRVTGVPKTVADSGAEILGAVPEDDFVAQLLAEPASEDRPPT
jgi:glutaredoxin-like protein